MISARALDQAVADAVVTREQADRLRAIEAGLVPVAAVPRAAGGQAVDLQDDETLRFISGFADIFVTIGLGLFLGALAVLMNAGTGSTLMFTGLACCSWVLAEFFTYKRRMALPSIVLLVVFVGAVFMLAAQIATTVLPPSPPFAKPSELPHSLIAARILSGWLAPAIAAIAAALMAALHYIRFRVPITVAAGAAALCILAFSIVLGLVVPDANETLLNALMLVLGLAMFALAMRFDMSDPARVTRRTDIAFWLHLLAAPMIVHPLIRGFLHGLDTQLTTGAALGILWVFLALGIVAVVIDRRAILVSGLVYAGVAYGSLVRAAGLTSFTVPVVLLSLGAFILLLSAGWHPLRRALLRRLPVRLAGRLPHPLVTSTS